MKHLYTAAATLMLGVPPAALSAPIVYVSDNNGNLATVDVVTGAATLIGNSGTVLTDIAFDAGGALYGISFNTLYRVNTTNAALTAVGPTLASVNALTFGSNGTLYAAGSTNLYSLSTATGASSIIGATGFTSSGDLTFRNGILYLAANGSSDNLVTIDLPTGAGTLVGSFGLPAVYGLSRASDNVIYANSNRAIYTVDPTTGATTFASSYTYAGAGIAFGSAFLNESTGPGSTIPEPATWSLMIIGFGLSGASLRRRAGVSTADRSS